MTLVFSLLYYYYYYYYYIIIIIIITIIIQNMICPCIFPPYDQYSLCNLHFL